MTIMQIIGIIIIFVWLFLGFLSLNENIFKTTNWLLIIFIVSAPFIPFLEKLF